MRAIIPTARPSNGVSMALVVALVVILGACTKNAETSSPSTGSLARATTSTTAPGSRPSQAAPAAAACSATVLEPILRAKYVGAGLADLVCSADAAVATITGAGAPAGGGVAFFLVKDGSWVLVADGPAADADGLRPANLSTIMLASWKDKRSPPVPTAPRAVTPGGKGPTTTDSCRKESDNSVCSSTTAPRKPKATTTTKAPTTSQPPSTLPPPSN